MNRVSSKTAARNRRYLEERERYLRGHPQCEHAFQGICATRANQIDHRVPRGLAPGRVDDPTNFIASCPPCHHHRTNNLTREERQDLGLGIYAEPVTTPAALTLDPTGTYWTTSTGTVIA